MAHGENEDLKEQTTFCTAVLCCVEARERRPSAGIFTTAEAAHNTAEDRREMCMKFKRRKAGPIKDICMYNIATHVLYSSHPIDLQRNAYTTLYTNKKLL